MRELTRDEVEMLIRDGGGEVDGCEWEEMEEVRGASRRWHTQITTIFSVPGVGFMSVEWDRANTEVQEHEFWEQVPKKVKRVAVVSYAWEVSE